MILVCGISLVTAYISDHSQKKSVIAIFGDGHQSIFIWIYIYTNGKDSRNGTDDHTTQTTAALTMKEMGMGQEQFKARTGDSGQGPGI